MTCRIFIADDHPIIVNGLTRLLGERYHVVGSSFDGQDCLAQLPQTVTDILLLDLAMPERDGLDVLRTLRSRESRLKIVIFTTKISDGDLREALRLQIDGIILKNAPEQALFLCLEAVFDGKRWLDKSLMQRALTLTVETDTIRRGATPFGDLTTRERSVAHMMARGLRNQEIAREINVSESTVKFYAGRIFIKLGAKNRADVARMVSQRPSEDSEA